MSEPGEADAPGDGASLADYDYDLPEERIALRPASPRDAARLLVSHPDRIEDAVVRDLPRILAPGDRLVVNVSRVIPARLTGERVRGEGAARVELTLLAERQPGEWEAFAKPAKRIAPGDALRFPGPDGPVEGTVTARDGGTVWVRFHDNPLGAGTMPLPPYIASRRAPDARDELDYQTVYAADPGSVAAPTAGLHFTERLLAALEARGVRRAALTLHVGIGTFRPVETEDPEEHEMHPERYRVSAEAARTINEARAAGGRVWAVGTTAVRTLESVADEEGRVRPGSGTTDLFIRPPYDFRVVDCLLTNFHLPRSTLLMLVAALAGYERTMAAYAEAVARGYRFYSYGDAMAVVGRP